MAGLLTLAKGAAPSTPSSGNGSLFLDTEGRAKVLDATGVLKTLSDSARFNWLRNSGFWFAQRQAPGTLTTYSTTTGRAFTADGWAVTNENASVQYIRTDTQAAPESGLQGRFYGTYSKITANGKIVVSQCLEGGDAIALRGRTVRFQIWAKASVSTVLRLGMVQLTSAGTIDTLPATYISAFGGSAVDPTLGTNLSYIAPKSGVTPDNGTINGNAVDVTATTAWQRFGAVFDVPSNCKNILASVWSNAQVGTGASFSLSQCSLSDGYELQDWVPAVYSQELRRVQRYYQKSFLVDTLPAQNVGLNTGEIRGVAGKAGAVANAGFIAIQYLQPMRATPTTNTLYNPAAANALARNVTGAADMGATAITGATANNFYAAVTGVAATAVGDLIAIHYTSDAEI